MGSRVGVALAGDCVMRLWREVPTMWYRALRRLFKWFIVASRLMRWLVVVVICEWSSLSWVVSLWCSVRAVWSCASMSSSICSGDWVVAMGWRRALIWWVRSWAWGLACRCASVCWRSCCTSGGRLGVAVAV
eukprot:14605811-Alexandrium_andersonii.AAC.1